MISFWSALLGAALALLANAALRWWQYRRDLWMGHGRDFCAAADALASLATEYWLKSGTPQPRQPAPNVLASDEARLLGMLAKVDGLWPIVSVRFSPQSIQALEQSLARLSETATGGQFQVRGRAVDPGRAQLAQTIAADLVVDVWRCTAEAMNLRGTVAFIGRSRMAHVIGLIIIAGAVGFFVHVWWAATPASEGPRGGTPTTSLPFR